MFLIRHAVESKIHSDALIKAQRLEVSHWVSLFACEAFLHIDSCRCFQIGHTYSFNLLLINRAKIQVFII